MIDIYSHIRNLFPAKYQREINLDLADNIIIRCFSGVNISFDENKTKFLKRAGYSAQRLSLEFGLIETFGLGITVVNGDIAGSGYVYNSDETIIDEQEIFLFNSDENVPDPAGEKYFYNINESGGSASGGFVVNVPVAYIDSEQDIISFIERVRCLGTFYEIIFY